MIEKKDAQNALKLLRFLCIEVKKQAKASINLNKDNIVAVAHNAMRAVQVLDLYLTGSPGSAERAVYLKDMVGIVTLIQGQGFLCPLSKGMGRLKIVSSFHPEGKDGVELLTEDPHVSSLWNDLK